MNSDIHDEVILAEKLGVTGQNALVADVLDQYVAHYQDVAVKDIRMRSM